jgi:hypothetical protein
MTRTLVFRRPLMLLLLGPCLAVLAFVWSLAPASARAGGFYNVSECSPGNPGTPDASVQGVTTDYSASTSCGSGNWLQVESVADAPAGEAKQWSYTAPAGTRIERFNAGYSLVGDSSPDGNRSYFFIKRYGQSGQETLSVVGLGSTAGTYDSSQQNLGPFSAVGIGLFCSKASGSCGHAPGQFSRLSAISFRMEDLSPPSPPVVAGDAAGGKWVSGTTQVAVGDVDSGGGVYRTTAEVNGTQVVNDVICSPDLDADGYASSMAPCDAIELRAIPMSTKTAPFTDGSANTVKFCTHEYGVGAASTCTTRTFKVDNVAPAAPQSVEVAGGSGWHRDSDFDLSWVNPEQTNAPISGAVVTVRGPGGYVETTTHTGADIESVDGVTVPDVGAYTADVNLIDEAGNQLAANKTSVDLKFDDTVPVKSDPEKANGWISRAELAGGYDQHWSKPSALAIPPSGIDGYRVVVNPTADTDPCAGATDPRACSGPITELGVNTTSRILGESALSEGANYVHVVPVSGSGMRATAVGRTPLKVDLTDPTTTIDGIPSGWVNHPVALKATADDSLSGMTDTAEYPDDSPPRTVLAVDGVTHEDLDSSVSTTIADEGSHAIEYWARDLAGNENDGTGSNATPGAGVVRIDTTSPNVAFTNSQDAADPDQLVAPVGDALSGVVSGGVDYRRADSQAWTPLDTELRNGELRARIDSNDLELGVRYEFRARATDAAGNSSTTSDRADGSDMSVIGPFRSSASIPELTINGKRKAKTGYGKRARIGGRLLDGSREPIQGAEIELVQTFDPGSSRAATSSVVTSDAAGRFRARLPRGPSRSVVAEFAGDKRRLGTTSKTARLRVKGKVGLRVTRRVSAGDRATFSGRVRAAGAKFTREGKAVEVQVKIGSRWKTVGRSLRTDKAGRYRLRYRFVATYTRPVRYRFRAVVLRERGWPYLPSVSKQRSVLVRP